MEKNIQNEINAAVRKRVREEALANEAEKDIELTGAFVRDCLYSNEVGDGALFAAIYRGIFVFNKTSSLWYRWAGHHWEIDVMDQAHAAVDKVALKYLAEVERLSSNIKAIGENYGPAPQKMCHL